MQGAGPAACVAGDRRAVVSPPPHHLLLPLQPTPLAHLAPASCRASRFLSPLPSPPHHPCSATSSTSRAASWARAAAAASASARRRAPGGAAAAAAAAAAGVAATPVAWLAGLKRPARCLRTPLRPAGLPAHRRFTTRCAALCPCTRASSRAPLLAPAAPSCLAGLGLQLMRAGCLPCLAGLLQLPARCWRPALTHNRYPLPAATAACACARRQRCSHQRISHLLPCPPFPLPAAATAA